MRYFVETVNGYGPNRQPRTWYRIIGMESKRSAHAYATSHDPAIAQRICDMLNGTWGGGVDWQNRAHEINGRLMSEQAKVAGLVRELAAARVEITELRKHVLGAQQPETDDALRNRIKRQGVYPRDEWRLETAQGHNLDKLADEYGLRRCPGNR